MTKTRKDDCSAGCRPVPHHRGHVRASGCPSTPGSRASLRPAVGRMRKNQLYAADRPRSDAVSMSTAFCLTEHRVEFGVVADRPYFLSAAAGDRNLGSPFKRLLA